MSGEKAGERLKQKTGKVVEAADSASRAEPKPPINVDIRRRYLSALVSTRPGSFGIRNFHQVRPAVGALIHIHPSLGLEPQCHLTVRCGRLLNVTGETFNGTGLEPSHLLFP